MVAHPSCSERWLLPHNMNRVFGSRGNPISGSGQSVISFSSTNVGRRWCSPAIAVENQANYARSATLASTSGARRRGARRFETPGVSGDLPASSASLCELRRAACCAIEHVEGSIGRKVLDSFKNPVYPFAFMNYGAIALARLGDWREWHEKDAEGERLCIAKRSRSLTHPLTTPRSLSPCNRKGRKEVAASLPTS